MYTSLVYALYGAALISTWWLTAILQSVLLEDKAKDDDDNSFSACSTSTSPNASRSSSSLHLEYEDSNSSHAIRSIYSDDTSGSGSGRRSPSEGEETFQNMIKRSKPILSPLKNKEKFSSDEKRDQEKSEVIFIKSPYNLIYEDLEGDPWKVLITTIIMNRVSSAKDGRLIAEAFLQRWSTPKAVLEIPPEIVEEMMAPLGDATKRARCIRRFSEDYIKKKKWRYPSELYGIGRYGNDVYKIFCINEWKTVKPIDTMLHMYHNWLVTNRYQFGLE